MSWLGLASHMGLAFLRLTTLPKRSHRCLVLSCLELLCGQNRSKLFSRFPRCPPGRSGHAILRNSVWAQGISNVSWLGLIFPRACRGNLESELARSCKPHGIQFWEIQCGHEETRCCGSYKGVNDLLRGGAPQSQRHINANKIDTGSGDLQACCANEASQA